MNFDWKPYLIPVVIALFVWNLWLRIDALQGDLEQSRATISRLEASAAELKTSVVHQNEAVLALQVAAGEQEQAAARRAEQVQASLPRLIRKDQAAGTAPKEMNQWLELLFSLP